MPSIPVAALVFALNTGHLAAAADWYLESVDQPARSDAVALSRAVNDAGYRGRVVRRLEEGAGWQYIVRIEGFKGEEDARAAASDLPDAMSKPIMLFSAENGNAVLVEVLGGAVGPSVGSPADGPSLAPVEHDADEWLERVLAAHGGPDAVDVIEASNVRFSFRRTLADGQVLDHTWARRGEEIYLEVKPVKGGKAQASRTLVSAGKAWLAVNDGDYEAQDLEKTRNVVGLLAPERVVPIVLAVSRELQRPEFSNLDAAGSADSGGIDGIVLSASEKRSSGAVRLVIDSKTHRILELALEGDGVVHRYGGYPAAGTAVPALVTTTRNGAISDTVEILALEVNGELPDALFLAPR